MNGALFGESFTEQVLYSSSKICQGSGQAPCSINWKVIKQGFLVFMKGIGWNVGSNSKLSFWSDNWVKGKSVKELIQGPIHQSEQDVTIEDVRQGGKWHWNAISFDLLPCIKGRILAIPIQLYGEKWDSMSWKASKYGEFTIAIAYTLA